jgi:hypothetical protein
VLAAVVSPILPLVGQRKNNEWWVAMRAFVAGLALALILSATPSIARADDGEGDDATADKPSDDPGIAALHRAIDDMRDARTALRAECPNMGDAKCRADFKKAREAFKDAHDKAIETHHAFKQAEKKARDEAKQKAKARHSESPKPKESPKPSATPRG